MSKIIVIHLGTLLHKLHMFKFERALSIASSISLFLLYVTLDPFFKIWFFERLLQLLLSLFLYLYKRSWAPHLSNNSSIILLLENSLTSIDLYFLHFSIHHKQPILRFCWYCGANYVIVHLYSRLEMSYSHGYRPKC